ncbi:MAG: gliding motility protein GldN [Bacteroidales bacterium]|nr:gliding motility protein GldN [Bacteroidales bacterium]
MYQRLRTAFPLLLLLFCQTIAAQTRPDMVHTEVLPTEQRPIPYPYLREADVVWSTMLWKTIDLNEAFNQYMYFPLDQEDRSGKKSLAYVLWEAMEREEIPIYEDDELLIPIDNQLFVQRYTKPDTVQLEIGYDDDDNEIYETVITPKYFDGAEVFQYALREAWFIGKQDTRQDSRRLALAPMKDVTITLKSTREDVYMGRAALFWVPMQHPSVRAVLARQKAYYDENNIINQPSWDNIFISQLYTAFVTRESNRYERTISRYLVGKDALMEAAAIEEKVFEIGEDMWEY